MMRAAGAALLLAAAKAEAQNNSDGAQLFLAPSATWAQNLSMQAQHFDEGPCDGEHGPQREPSTVSFCQPSERSGTYGVRYWTMQADDMCARIASGECFTLDDMHCDGSPDLCLKWGFGAYAGRALLPAGVRLSGWGGWSCAGKHHFSTSGPTPQPYDFWDWWSRVGAFKLSLIDGYTCSPGASSPVQPPPCKPADITGRWRYWVFPAVGDHDGTQHLHRLGDHGDGGRRAELRNDIQAGGGGGRPGGRG